MKDETRKRALEFVRDGHCRRVYKRYGNAFKLLRAGPATKILWQLARDRMLSDCEQTRDMLSGASECRVILSPAGEKALAMILTMEEIRS